MLRLQDMFEEDGTPFYVLGVNYQSAEYGHITDLWEDESALTRIVDADFELMKRMGIKAIRIQSAVFHKRKTFDNILLYARKYGIYVMPNLSIGDLMQGSEGRWFQSQGGEVVQVSAGAKAATRFANERTDPFDDGSTARAKDYLTGLLHHYRDEEMILAWDIANEPTYALYGMSSAKYAQYCGKDSRTAREITSRWTEEICSAAREADPNHPVTVGTDHSIVLMDVGFDLVDFSRTNDLMTTHHYSRATSGYILLDEVCSLRDSYMPAYITAFSRVTGRPFASGECGNNSYVMSEENQGLHYRMMLYSGLINGAIGTFPWCFHAYDWAVPRIREGYDGAPAESEFGIVRPDHTLKPAGEEFVSFGRLVGSIDFARFRLAPPDAAVLLPASYYSYLYEHRASLFNAFLLAKQAHLNVGIALPEDISNRFRVVIVPTTHLSVKEMDILRAFVQGGGCLILSVTEALSGRVSYLRDVVGFTHTDYDFLPAEVQVTMEHDLGRLARGERLTYRTDTLGWYVGHEKPENERQYFTMVKPTTAEVIGRDGAGRPSVTLNRHGEGQVLCFTFPVEYCLGHMPRAFREDRTSELYAAASALSLYAAEVECDSPALELGVFRADCERIVLVINHTTGPVNTELRFRTPPGAVKDYTSGALLAACTDSIPISLPANGVTVLRVEQAARGNELR